ncbi:hypothetical protein M427DRAFT_52815 [Gonapodya prolifera JEL478]|uniref:RBR-type E3 ubiquitin transferase n=1 Tax=Gonapodya prolifera (strain JEL478) TaxID=1344416 RepID=A0A139ARK9_GONPJ|nr:hypothetical protein M427DRAFT_52815 [Gonapodya prolifera JEL478]|eukprot:KXS19377.1 hypothetical protein M427DRAFT_52815 [Gonapodya prolifera JEL478]
MDDLDEMNSPVSPISPQKRRHHDLSQDDDEDEDALAEFAMDEDGDQDDDFDGGDGEDDDDVDIDMGNSGVFSPVVADRDRDKTHIVSFTVHAVPAIVETQTREANHVATLLGTQPEHAATLLRAFRWNKERLIDLYFNDPDATSATAGVILDSRKQPRPLVVPGFVCDVCCADDDDLLSLALSCGHRFCVGCYGHYVETKIKDEGESRRIQCMQRGCGVIVDEKTVEQCVGKDVLAKYKDLLLRTFVDDSDFYRWCPAPNCQFAVECHVTPARLARVVPTVTCQCGTTFCFGCGATGDHKPCTCWLVKKWLKKCADDSETSNWISANTKECTKCGSTIEKNGGCNHMTCRRCKHEFCWVCAGPWSEHGTQWYNCNRFDEKEAVEARDHQAKSRAALQRYLHYYNRYANHEQSAKLSQELHSKTEKKMSEVQANSTLSWIEVQFLRKAVDVVVDCRTTLKWTYAFAYYLARDNQTALFEDNQRDLEMAVEQLSELLERPLEPEADKIAELKRVVQDKSVYCSSRREVVLEDTAKGLLEDRWKYNTDAQPAGSAGPSGGGSSSSA